MTVNIHAPFQTSYSIHTDNKELVRSLKLKYGRYATISSYAADITIGVFRDSSVYAITSFGNTVYSIDPISYIEDMFFTYTRYDDSIFALHGGAVSWQDKAYMFLAPTTSGKTTLVSYLTSNGFGYITDDCILLNREKFIVYPYTAPVHLRSGGFHILQNCISHIVAVYDALLDRYVYTPKNCVADALPLSGIFYIERTECENTLIEMSATDRIAALMLSPITQYTVSSDYLRLITRLSKVNSVKLCYCDMPYVSEVIKNGR